MTATIPTVLNFSGNDSAGLAGIAADIRTETALGVHSAAVITANTAQNNYQVIAINPVTNAVFASQLQAVSVLPIAVVKVGLLGSVEQVAAIAAFVKQHSLPLVLDTVFASSSGSHFLAEPLIAAIKNQLIPLSTLVTPNIHEAEILSGAAITSTAESVIAADNLLALGAGAVLIKGGHLNQADWVQDYFTDGDKRFWLGSPKIVTRNSRGTGCALAAAISSALAKNYSLYDAVVIGKMAINQGLEHGYGLTDDYGPVNITHFPHQQHYLPVLSVQPITRSLPAFPACNQPKLGLYPVVDRAHWINRLAAAGVTTLQLRVKDLQGDALAEEIKTAVALSEHHQVRLFINDYWQLAIQCGAYGVHLGQEDLETADMDEIRNAGLRLGISTHCHYEVARAHYYRPSYIACGPIYSTTTKIMPWVPHGLSGLSYWRSLLDYPLVAIGGINADRIHQVAAMGVDGIAMITAITLADNPEQTTAAFVKVCDRD